MNTPEPAVPESVRVAIAATPTLADFDASFAAIEAAVDPIAAVVFTEHAAGREVDQDAIMRALVDRDGLAIESKSAHRIRNTLDRNAEAGDACHAIEEKLLWRSSGAVLAATGALGWEVWRAEHPDDLLPDWQDIPVRRVAKHIARRCRDVLSESLSPYEAAWAAIEGARRARLPIARTAWSDALEGAFSGERERLTDIANRLSA